MGGVCSSLAAVPGGLVPLSILACYLATAYAQHWTRWDTLLWPFVNLLYVLDFADFIFQVHLLDRPRSFFVGTLEFLCRSVFAAVLLAKVRRVRNSLVAVLAATSKHTEVRAEAMRLLQGYRRHEREYREAVRALKEAVTPQTAAAILPVLERFDPYWYRFSSKVANAHWATACGAYSWEGAFERALNTHDTNALVEAALRLRQLGAFAARALPRLTEACQNEMFNEPSVRYTVSEAVVTLLMTESLQVEMRQEGVTALLRAGQRDTLRALAAVLTGDLVRAWESAEPKVRQEVEAVWRGVDGDRVWPVLVRLLLEGSNERAALVAATRLVPAPREPDKAVSRLSSAQRRTLAAALLEAGRRDILGALAPLLGRELVEPLGSADARVRQEAAAVWQAVDPCQVGPVLRRILAAPGEESRQHVLQALHLSGLASGKGLRRLEGHTFGVRSGAVLPDGRRALSGSWDESLRLWLLPLAVWPPEK
ncbi:MAG: hypothetical protein NZ700_11885 [Gemmataceae bacterium]|nr:hypothetical protein [Gemmataceae bacterium]MDW8265966.1 hypothetical protein [Gemmataceae bacterium]